MSAGQSGTSSPVIRKRARGQPSWRPSSRRDSMRFAPSLMLVLLAMSSARCLAGEQPSMSRAAWSADLDTLYGQMKSVHPELHHRTDAATMDAYVRRFHREIPHDSWPRFVMGMYRLLAMAGDGHTAFYPPPDAGPGFDTRYPFLPAAFSDGLYVTAAAPAYKDAVGRTNPGHRRTPGCRCVSHGDGLLESRESKAGSSAGFHWCCADPAICPAWELSLPTCRCP